MHPDSEQPSHRRGSVDYIIGGFERGGTTLLSDLFRANGYESGFECGVLLAPTPAEFHKQPLYWPRLLPGWKIDGPARARAVTEDFEGFYRTICDAAFPHHDGPFFDKTPRYMQHLGLHLSRAPFLKGALIIHRDPRAIFLSNARRRSPDLSADDAVDKDFDMLVENYLAYTIGSIAHLGLPNVLFVPYEELVTRQETWLTNLGLFTRAQPFQARSAASRFKNVYSDGMDIGKVVEFRDALGPAMQARILDATRLAAPFFCDVSERAHYGALWQRTRERITEVLRKFDLPPVGVEVDGAYFEPFTYLLRYPDVLERGVNPIRHFRNRGTREQRLAC